MRRCDACEGCLGQLTKYQAMFGHRCPTCDYWYPPVNTITMELCAVTIAEEFILEEAFSQLMLGGEWHGVLLTDVGKATTLLEEELVRQARIYDKG